MIKIGQESEACMYKNYSNLGNWLHMYTSWHVIWTDWFLICHILEFQNCYGGTLAQSVGTVGMIERYSAEILLTSVPLTNI